MHNFKHPNLKMIHKYDDRVVDLNVIVSECIHASKQHTVTNIYNYDFSITNNIVKHKS